ncbi:MAG: type II secretion system F family protein, partial [Gammaproteobacteria bacterium]|nr:type II secretion system F family protein [Gammaproteobacteria bacterium]
FNPWTTEKRRAFYDMAAGFIEDGKPAYETLEILYKRWTQKKDQRAKNIEMTLLAMRGKDGRAKSFAEALALWLPPIEAMAIHAGERAGNLAQGLRMAHRLASVKSEITGALYGELVYPGFLLLMLFALLYMLNIAILPVFEEISPRPMWPTQARFIAVLGDNIFLIIGGIVAFITAVVVAFRVTAPRMVGGVRDFLDQYIAPWSIHRQVTSSIVLTSFAAFLKAGIPLTEILQSLSKIATPWERHFFDIIRSRMRRGLSDAEAMGVHLFDEETRWEISIYGTTSQFATALESIATRLAKKTLSKIKSSASMVRTLIMFMVAGMVIMIYGSFFSVIMSARSVLSS